MSERLQKVLARAGIASRRAAETLIVEGRVSVNGKPATRLGTKIDPEKDFVRVDGKRIRNAGAGAERVYLALHKPRGYVTTLADPEGRPTLRDLIRGLSTRVFPVGRLDYQSEGLLLLTNDGALAHALMHPSHGVSKTYLVKVRGVPDGETRRKLSQGIVIEGRKTLAARVELRKGGANSWLEITIQEGRYHQVRRMFQAVGHPVQKLRRIRYDGVELGRLPAGRYRALTVAELRRLRRAAGEAAGARAGTADPA